MCQFFKYILFSCFLFFLANSVSAEEQINKLLNKLEVEIDKKDVYQNKKLQRLEFLKSEMVTAINNDDQKLEYDLTVRLQEEYQSFIYDSAFKYVVRMIHLAQQLGDETIITKAKIQLAFTYLSSGLFKESLDTLLSLNASKMPIKIKVDYYTVLARTYFDFGDYHGDDIYTDYYNNLGNNTIDSAINLLSDTTPQYWMAIGLRKMKSEDYDNAVNAFNFVVSNFNVSEHDYAIATSSLATA